MTTTSFTSTGSTLLSPIVLPSTLSQDYELSMASTFSVDSTTATTPLSISSIVALTVAIVAPTAAIIVPTVAIIAPAVPVVVAMAAVLAPVAVRPGNLVGNAPCWSHHQVLFILNHLHDLWLIHCSSKIDQPFVSILNLFFNKTDHLLYFRQNLVILHPPEEAPIVEQTPMAPVLASGPTKKSSKGDKELSIGKGLSARYVYSYSPLIPYFIHLL